MSGNTYNLYVDIDYETDYYSSNSLDTTNTVDGDPVYWWVAQTGATVPAACCW